MAVHSRKVTEWDLNEMLDTILMTRYLEEYFIISKDGDLHSFMGYEKQRLNVLNFRAVDGPLEPQSFRPDLIALDKQGQSYIIETKIGHGVSSLAQYIQLAVQALTYANTFMFPAWPGGRIWSTYPFLNYLHKAYWYRRRREYGKFIELKEEHYRHFKLTQSLAETDFNPVPQVIFLLEHVNESRLLTACRAVRDKDFKEFEGFAIQHLPIKSRYRSSLNELEANWSVLREVKFYSMIIDLSKIKSALGDRLPLT